METMTREKYLYLAYADNRTFTEEKIKVDNPNTLYRYYFPDDFDFSINYEKVKDDFYPFRFNQMFDRSIIEFMDYSYFNTWIIQPKIIRCAIKELRVSLEGAEKIIKPRFYNCTIKFLYLENNEINNKVDFCGTFSGCTIENVLMTEDKSKKKICAIDLREMFYLTKINIADLNKLLNFIHTPQHVVNSIPLSHMFGRATIEVSHYSEGQKDIYLNHFFEDRTYPHYTGWLHGLNGLFNHTTFYFYDNDKPLNIFLDALKFDKDIFKKYKYHILSECKNMFDIIIENHSEDINPVVRFHMDSSWPIEVLLAAVGDNRSPEKINFYKTDNKTIIEITN